MKHLLSLTLFHHPFLLLLFRLILALDPPAASCRNMCGSVEVKYPFGTGPGCGSPRFQPYVTCSSSTTTTTSSPSSSSSSTGSKESTTETLMLTTHTGSYPITSISYATYTLTVTPPAMSTCFSMQPSPSNFGLDWLGPFQPGPSTFILLACRPPTSSLSAVSGENVSPICDPNSHLCASLYTCPSVVSLGLPVFPPTNTCCVYSPANLNGKDELDLNGMKCEGFASVVSLGDYATDPGRWEYGVALKYNGGVLETSIVETKCKSCELSDGVCGYSTDDEKNEENDNSFVCVCKSGINTTTDCLSGYYGQDEDLFWGDSASFRPSSWKIWHGILVGLIICIAVGGRN